MKQTPENPGPENEPLRARLEDADRTPRAAASDEVDGVVAPGDPAPTKNAVTGSPDPLYRRIMETMNTGAVALDGRGTVLYANAVLARMLGRHHEALVGSPMGDLVSSSHRKRFASFVQASGNRRGDFALLTAAGQELFVRLSASDQRAGEKAMTFLVATDISDRIRAEKALERTCDELEKRFEERTARLSDAVSRLRAEVAAREHAEEELRRWGERLERRVRERTGELNEAYERLKAEIRDREKTEERLRQAHKLEAVGTLAGGIAHDFNNMLAVIIGNAEMAFEDTEDEGARKSVKRILDVSMRQRDLVRQILTFSRKGERPRRPVRIAQLTGETYALLRSSLPPAVTMELKTHVSYDVMIEADPAQVRQMIVNLVNNAVYAMREKGGTIILGVSNVDGPDSLAHEDAGPGRYVKITVKDTGTGISPEVRRRIFEPFFTTKKPGEGVGMGLAVVYGIVKGYGGTIEVESEVGAGSIFTVFLPEAEAAPVEKEGEEALPVIESGRVLLVDDEPGVMETTATLLAHLGCHVTSFAKGAEALAAFGKDPRGFDLVITDQTMPGMTGITLARKLLAIRKDLPIILCTGYSETVSSEKALEAGIRACVMKPVTKAELARAVRGALERPDDRPAPRLAEAKGPA